LRKGRKILARAQTNTGESAIVEKNGGKRTEVRGRAPLFNSHEKISAGTPPFGFLRENRGIQQDRGEGRGTLGVILKPLKLGQSGKKRGKGLIRLGRSQTKGTPNNAKKKRGDAAEKRPPNRQGNGRPRKKEKNEIRLHVRSKKGNNFIASEAD